MATPSEQLAVIVSQGERGLLTETETFFRIVSWAGGPGVTDDDIRAMPADWRKRIADELRERPEVKQTHPVLFRWAVPGEWTDDRVAETRARRDRAFGRLERVLLAETSPPASPETPDV